MLNQKIVMPVLKTLLLSASATVVPLLIKDYFTPIIVGITAVCGLILTIYKMLNEIKKYNKNE